MYILIKFMCLDPISCLLASALGPRWDLYVWSNIDFHFYKYLVHYENKSEWNTMYFNLIIINGGFYNGESLYGSKRLERTFYC